MTFLNMKVFCREELKIKSHLPLSIKRLNSKIKKPNKSINLKLSELHLPQNLLVYRTKTKI
jgi:hypothetical protein